jgi:hypothetical protein
MLNILVSSVTKIFLCRLTEEKKNLSPIYHYEIHLHVGGIYEKFLTKFSTVRIHATVIVLLCFCKEFIAFYMYKVSGHNFFRIFVIRRYGKTDCFLC